MEKQCSDKNVFIHDKRSRALILWLYAAAVIQVIHLHFSLYLASRCEFENYRLEIFSSFINTVVDFSDANESIMWIYARA